MIVLSVAQQHGKAEVGPERLCDEVSRPHTDKMITDRIQSIVYLIDPGARARGNALQLLVVSIETRPTAVADFWLASCHTWAPSAAKKRSPTGPVPVEM